ncbi:hypothetical protein [Xenorhabdus cabanillasii]|uniref:XRE family transcriptional regulator n=1 Tax=Xenorhabdus cabanillasii JM26 TaxID=1427517 RepID=W1J6H0_9GAMM|nr:hypothetical protein [Xenorhabdus cabanillasii]PHM75388.1 transcriptional regulator [Xenorhabdus cabanillasii JM26]CDL86352.1 hypothetical protein XCR1_3070003 [Xenorhabdus cabanillasii JM26]
MSTIGNRIRKECERLGLSQTDFSGLAGYSFDQQASYECDEIPFDCLQLHALTEYGFDILYIITGGSIRRMNISPDEQEIVEHYRAMNEASRLKIPEISNESAYKRNIESIGNK